MTHTAAESWQAANQARLTAELARVRAALLRHAELPDDAADPPDWPPDLSPPAVALVCHLFGLSAFERDILLLCAGVELDARFAPLCAAAARDPAATFPTYGLALAALPEAHWSALTPDAPLRRWRLIELAPHQSLSTAPLRIDEQMLHYLAGLPYPNERLAGLVDPVPWPGELVPSQARAAERLHVAWFESPASVVVQLSGPDAGDRRAVAASASFAAGWELAAITSAAIPTDATELAALARLCDRESALRNVALLVECDGSEAEPARAAAVQRFVERLNCPAALSDREPRYLGVRAAVTLDVPRPSAREQSAVWRESLGPESEGLNGVVDELTAQFSLAASAIRDIAAGHPPAPCELRLACRAHSRPRLDALARRVEPVARWDDLVLSESQGETLRQIAAQVRHRATVYERWGVATPGARGLGVTALFAGPSGTGKTLAAEVLAAELDLDLYCVDLSAVVSKYIGETEKNLRRVFDAAEQGGAVLQFDEADALFGKRGEVKDSHDRYANIEVSYLLRRMEEYRGLAVLTTNMKSALDPAFLRRLRFVVQFPFPGGVERQRLWRAAFGPGVPTEGLDFPRLARVSVAGGNIRSAAVAAAFLAADAGEPVRMRHVYRALAAELAKLERPLTELEGGPWE